ncbi:MAG: 30S ribosome-binding factor RbfA [Alphaproteobacteria bacterium]|nr:30S ribosome-binding factor RbfA [Alphaproteobacteria bacterium]
MCKETFMTTIGKGQSKAPSQRQLRVAEEIRHVIGKMFMEDNLFISGLKPAYIMVTEVSISPDLSYATVYIQGIGDIDTDEQILLLNKHKGAFRYKIGKAIRLRIVPDIIFKSDSGFETSQYIEELLNSPRVRADIEKEIEEE